MAELLPTGNVTFLFTDIEGSTKLLQQLGDRYQEILKDHHGLMRGVIEHSGGFEVSTEGDAFFVVFPSASAAATAAADMQRALAAHSWIDDVAVSVRMGLHTGEAELFGDNYGGIDVHRAARIASAAHGGQILLSDATRALTQGSLPEGLRLKDLGEHRLKDLERSEHLFQLCVGGLRTDFPVPRTLDARPNNLPQQLTPFVARDRELKEIVTLFLDNRLVTLTGPGGTGKTRLSLELAARLMHGYRDGAFVAFLAPVSDAELVPSAIAEVLGVREEGTTPIADTVKDHLADREMFLVLDNFEQILDAARYVAELLLAAPGISLLVSSRGALHVSGEQEYPVPPMTLPNPEHLPAIGALMHFEAIELFLQRARSVNPSFMLDDESAGAVASICWRLDGLPLAIELAAARLRVFSVHDLLKRLDKSLAVLTGGARDLPSRQQTLRNAISWSYELLDEPTQSFFRRLGTFVGSWNFDAVEAVVDPNGELEVDALYALESLIDQSLVRRYETDEGETRFRMLQTIREFALDVLEDDEKEKAAEAHARYFHDYALSAADALLQDTGAMMRVLPDHDNLRAALGWHIERGEANAGIEMGAALWRFWQLRSHLAEGRKWLEELMALPGADEGIRAKGEMALGSITYWQNDWPAMRQHYESGLELFTAMGDRAGMTEALYNNGFLGLIEFQPDIARGSFDKSRALAEETGDKQALGNAHWGLAMADIQDRKLEEAEEHANIALAIFEELESWFGIALAEFVFYQAARFRGDYATARQLAIRSYDRIGMDRDVTSWYGMVEMMSNLFMGLGAVEQGVLLAGKAMDIKESYGGGAPPSLVESEDPRENARRHGLSDERIDELLEQGKRMPLDEAIALARKDPSSF